jgi:hypothetical protein
MFGSHLYIGQLDKINCPDASQTRDGRVPYVGAGHNRPDRAYEIAVMHKLLSSYGGGRALELRLVFKRRAIMLAAHGYL